MCKSFLSTSQYHLNIHHQLCHWVWSLILLLRGNNPLLVWEIINKLPSLRSKQLSSHSIAFCLQYHHIYQCESREKRLWYLQSCLAMALRSVSLCPNLGLLHIISPDWADRAAYVVGVITRYKLVDLTLVVHSGMPTSCKCQSWSPTFSNGIERVAESRTIRVRQDMSFILLIISILWKWRLVRAVRNYETKQ